MSEPPGPFPPTLPAASPPAADVNGQLISSALTISFLGVIGLGLVLVGWALKDFDKVGIPLGVVVGALANSLTPPSGISNVIRAGLSKAPGG